MAFSMATAQPATFRANVAGKKVQQKARAVARAAPVKAQAALADYKDELIATATAIATPGKGLLAIDESNATAGIRLASIGAENTEDNRRAYREMLLSAPGLGEYIGGSILFDETLRMDTSERFGKKPFVQMMKEQGIIPGIKVDTGLRPLQGSPTDEVWCQGLDGLKERTDEYYELGARFAKWRTAISIPKGPTEMAVKEAAHGLARYAAICQSSGLVPIVEPEILLDGDHDIDRNLEVASQVWNEVFNQLALAGVMYEGILLKPSMVVPGADCPKRNTPEEVAEKTLALLKRRVPCAVPGIMFLSGGLSEAEASAYLNAMNQGENPWHVSFSYARALQNTCLKTWGAKDENFDAAQEALLKRARLNSLAQLGKYTTELEGADKSAMEGMFQKNYTY